MKSVVSVYLFRLAGTRLANEQMVNGQLPDCAFVSWCPLVSSPTLLHLPQPFTVDELRELGLASQHFVKRISNKLSSRSVVLVGKLSSATLPLNARKTLVFTNDTAFQLIVDNESQCH